MAAPPDAMGEIRIVAAARTSDRPTSDRDECLGILCSPLDHALEGARQDTARSGLIPTTLGGDTG